MVSDDNIIIKLCFNAIQNCFDVTFLDALLKELVAK